MSAEYATFGLAPAIRAGGVRANGDYQVHRDFVDFIVNDRPLLFQLSDLDAVSPLASDVPPAIFTAQVRSLLLEIDAPLPGGRYVIYGCPECEELGCGAVTAVIEQEGDDYLWRDFAWQTDDYADLTLNGYHGIGPFRFRGAEYRTALTSLLDGSGSARRRVLLIGARVALLAKLAAALRTIGIGADITRDAADVPADELRGYGAVAFGRAVTQEERAAVRAAFDRAGVEVAYVDGLAPIVPLLVAQIEHALDRSPADRRQADPAGRRRRRSGHRGHLALPGPAHRVPPRPSLPHPRPRGLRRDPGTRPASHRPGRQGGEGGVLRGGANIGKRAGGGDGARMIPGAMDSVGPLGSTV